MTINLRIAEELTRTYFFPRFRKRIHGIDFYSKIRASRIHETTGEMIPATLVFCTNLPPWGGNAWCYFIPEICPDSDSEILDKIKAWFELVENEWTKEKAEHEQKD